MKISSNIKTIDVDTGEVRIAFAPVILQSIALGSCIALVVYDRSRKIGGIAHIMLPGRSPTSINNSRYTEDAIDSLIESLEEHGVSKGYLEISIIGGANVLQEGDIPDKVIASVMDYLKKLNLELSSVKVGGTERRSVFLDTRSGDIYYTEGNNSNKALLTKTEELSSMGVDKHESTIK